MVERERLRVYRFTCSSIEDVNIRYTQYEQADFTSREKTGFVLSLLSNHQLAIYIHETTEYYDTNNNTCAGLLIAQHNSVQQNILMWLMYREINLDTFARCNNL